MFRLALPAETQAQAVEERAGIDPVVEIELVRCQDVHEGRGIHEILDTDFRTGDPVIAGGFPVQVSDVGTDIGLPAVQVEVEIRRACSGAIPGVTTGGADIADGLSDTDFKFLAQEIADVALCGDGRAR